MKAFSRLHETLSRGEFAVTGECGPPRGANKEVINKKIKLLNGFVDAVNVTDNQTAIVRMSSIAASAHLVAAGLEPVRHIPISPRGVDRAQVALTPFALRVVFAKRAVGG